MAIPRRLPMSHEQVFPLGAFLVSEVTPVRDFDKSTKDVPVQKRDDDTGFPVWQIDVLDGDPTATRAQRTVSIKIVAQHQPVPPKAHEGMPVTPIHLDGLEVTPYVDTNGKFARLAWSFRATGISALGKAA
ncbi:MAG: plasmid replication, integration and excision activator [Mobilicoccus sp.]|nr:plasmid replication, integration and excision activator [Mobilicoccus sp.]